MVRSLLFFTLLSAGIIAGCSSFGPVDPPEAVLPELTQEGLGTMGCTVDGRVLMGRKKRELGGLPAIYGAIGDIGNVVISLEDRYFDEGLALSFTTPTEDTTLATPHRWYVWQEPVISIRPDIYLEDPYIETSRFAESPEDCWIEFDRYEPYEFGVMAGTFSFDLLTPEGDTLRVRDGRFDVMLIGM